MTLINIEYGSIASSETMNSNFSYLDERINDTNTQINASISSILSNIATINSGITDISENLTSAVTTLENTITDYKLKTKLLVKKSGMVPNWIACRNITLDSETTYQATDNGYVLIVPETNAHGELYINDTEVPYKLRDNAYDNAALLTIIPVMKNDSVSANFTCEYAYFVPAAEISIENF